MPSILDSDKTENVSRALSTSMICNSKGERCHETLVNLKEY